MAIRNYFWRIMPKTDKPYTNYYTNEKVEPGDYVVTNGAGKPINIADDPQTRADLLLQYGHTIGVKPKFDVGNLFGNVFGAHLDGDINSGEERPGDLVVTPNKNYISTLSSERRLEILDQLDKMAKAPNINDDNDFKFNSDQLRLQSHEYHTAELLENDNIVDKRVGGLGNMLTLGFADPVNVSGAILRHNPFTRDFYTKMDNGYQSDNSFLEDLFGGNAGLFTDNFFSKYPRASVMGNLVTTLVLPTAGYLAKQGVRTAYPYLRYPNGKTLYHGSPKYFPLNEAKTGSYSNIGFHLGNKETAFTGDGNFPYKVRVGRKPDTEVLDINDNGIEYLNPESEFLSDQYKEQTGFDHNKVSLKLFNKGTTYKTTGHILDANGNVLGTNEIERVVVDLQSLYPKLPKTEANALFSRYLLLRQLHSEGKLPFHKYAKQVAEINETAARLLNDSGYKVVKYENTIEGPQYRDTGVPNYSYFVTDPKVMTLIPDFNMKFIPNFLTGRYQQNK